METRKVRAKVIMLPTKNKSLLHTHSKLSTGCEGMGSFQTLKLTDSKTKFEDLDWDGNIPQHLYFTTDEEIKEGDWCIDKYNQIWQFLDNCLIGFDADKNKRFRTDNVEGHKVKKIIATTDASLYVPITQDKPFDELPQPSDSFIKKYVEEYNAGRTILKVLVEYEKVYPKHFTYNPSENIIINLKIDSNNTINIKKVEPKLYTRGEIEILITNAFKAGYERSHSGYPHTDNWSKPKVEEFLKENL